MRFKLCLEEFQSTVFVGTLNVRCSSSSTQAIVTVSGWEVRLTRNKGMWFFSVDVAVRSKLLALITSSGLQETALLLRPQPTQFFFKYANLCTCTFLLPWVFLHVIFSTHLCTWLAKCVITEWKKKNHTSWHITMRYSLSSAALKFDD